MKVLIAALTIIVTATLTALAADAPPTDAVVATYAAIARAAYSDALSRAEALDQAVDGLLAKPSEETLLAARKAYLTSRPPYQQTEAYRFGNPVVDAWEGKVNAWPLDEGLIDYVDASYGTQSDENPLYAANVIANPVLYIDGKEVNASHLTPDFLAHTLAEAGGNESNVATGYHAIEFLLWGQNLHGPDVHSGTRPATDYDLDKCSNGNCDRRRAFLKSATTLLVADLKEMVGNWNEGGAALRAAQESGIRAIFTGMGSLSYGELAGQRLKLGLMLHDPKEAHECFSNSTDVSLMYDAVGIRNVYLGRYVRTDGSIVEGPSLSALVAASDPALDKEIRGLLDETLARFGALTHRAATVEKYDRMIAEGNAEGNAVVQSVVDALVAQTRGIERAIAALKLDVEIKGDDSLGSSNAVFH